RDKHRNPVFLPFRKDILASNGSFQARSAFSSRKNRVSTLLNPYPELRLINLVIAKPGRFLQGNFQVEAIYIFARDCFARKLARNDHGSDCC
ncbi:MAG TPA: hypothetical protein VLA49_16370, partial [Anaerolineales bacterium]|nr:hypothetical protein [Anaerolineales bacterium]